MHTHELVLELRRGLVTGELSPELDLGEIGRDFNENEWRVLSAEHFNFRVNVRGREFLVTVEDITYKEE